jgi:hypothetical protein
MRMLATSLLLAVVIAAVLPGRASSQAIKVTLLGTGGPPPAMNRFGPSTLVEAAGQRLVSMRDAAVCCGSRRSDCRSATSTRCSSLTCIPITSSASPISS